MKRWVGPLGIMLMAAIAAHAAVLYGAPAFIMDAAMSELAKRNIALHAFTAPQRITPQTQSVVRSSPDLFYSLCRYDLSEPENSRLHIEMGKWDDYQSLSFFDSSTNNFATIRGGGESVGTVLYPPWAELSDPTEGIISPTARGVVLIRRLAPTQQAFEAASASAKSDRCEHRFFGMHALGF